MCADRDVEIQFVLSQEIAAMDRVTKIFSAAVAIAMTAFTFGLIGESALASTDVQSMSAASHFVSTAVAGVHTVLVRLV